MAQLKHPAKSVKGVPTAGNRIRATTKEQLWARFGQWSAQAKAAYDPVKAMQYALGVGGVDFEYCSVAVVLGAPMPQGLPP
jgi:hypothetical protein